MLTRAFADSVPNADRNGTGPASEPGFCTGDLREALRFAAILLPALFVYGSVITTFTMSIDNEFPDTFDQDIGLGRWAISLLKRLLLADPYAAYITPVVFVVFLSLAVYIVGRTLRLSDSMLVVFGFLSVSFPALFYQVDFNVQSDAVGIGLALGAVSAPLFLQALRADRPIARRIALFFAACAATAISTATYQSLFTMGPGIVLLVLAEKIARGGKPPVARLAGPGILWLATSFVLFRLVSHGLQSVLSVSPSTYFATQIGWTHASFSASVSSAIRNAVTLCLGGNYYGNGIYLLATLACIAGIVVMLRHRRPVGAVLLAAILVLPFALNILLSFSFPPRTYVFQGFSFAYLIVFFLRFGLPARFVRPAAFAASCGALWFGTHVLASLVFADQMSWRADIVLAEQIEQRLHSAIPDYRDGVTPVYFHGGIQRANRWKPRGSDIYGTSFFHWDGGNNLRITSFMRANMIGEVRMAPLSRVRAIMDRIGPQPVFPATGSVFMLGGVAVVRLGIEPGTLQTLPE